MVYSMRHCAVADVHAGPRRRSPPSRRCSASSSLFPRKPLISEERVRSFAERQLRQICAGDVSLFAGTDFSFAGGTFKCLLKSSETQPRDVDIWPASAEDKALLVERLSASPSCATAALETRWNWQLKVGVPPVLVEVVKKEKHRCLADTLAGFDLGLSAIGVRVVSGAVQEVLIHPLALESVELREPILLLPLPNASFMLSTAERALRYSHELGWPRPEKQLAALLAEWSTKSNDFKQKAFHNYCATTRHEGLFTEILALFDAHE